MNEADRKYYYHDNMIRGGDNRIEELYNKRVKEQEEAHNRRVKEQEAIHNKKIRDVRSDDREDPVKHSDDHVDLMKRIYDDLTSQDIEDAKKKLNDVFKEMMDPPRQPADLEQEFRQLIDEMYEYVGAKVGAGQLTESQGEALIDMLDSRIIRPYNNDDDGFPLYEDDGWSSSSSHC